MSCAQARSAFHVAPLSRVGTGQMESCWVVVLLERRTVSPNAASTWLSFAVVLFCSYRSSFVHCK